MERRQNASTGSAANDGHELPPKVEAEAAVPTAEKYLAQRRGDDHSRSPRTGPFRREATPSALLILPRQHVDSWRRSPASTPPGAAPPRPFLGAAPPKEAATVTRGRHAAWAVAPLLTTPTVIWGMGNEENNHTGEREMY
jgi:hypothetical protein